MAVNVNILTRELKGAPLTSEELDLNFTNLKVGIESASPPGFNFAYDATNDILTIDNTVSGGDLDEIHLFPNLNTNTLRIGHVWGQVESKGSFVVNKRYPGQGVDTDDIFILKCDEEEIFKVREDGVFIFKAQNTVPDQVPSNTGGFYFDGEDFWTQAQGA